MKAFTLNSEFEFRPPMRLRFFKNLDIRATLRFSPKWGLILGHFQNNLSCLPLIMRFCTNLKQNWLSRYYASRGFIQRRQQNIDRQPFLNYISGFWGAQNGLFNWKWTLTILQPPYFSMRYNRSEKVETMLLAVLVVRRRCSLNPISLSCYSLFAVYLFKVRVIITVTVFTWRNVRLTVHETLVCHFLEF